MRQRKENPEDIKRARTNFLWLFLMCTALWVISMIAKGGV